MNHLVLSLTLLIALITGPLTAMTRDLKEIQQEGVLRHLGVPYANFVDGADNGLDVELIRLFAQEIGVRYEYVPTNWKSVISDLTGQQLTVKGNEVTVVGRLPIRGDVIANGLTLIPWRQKVIDFSAPTFPTQVWLIAASQSPLQPIVPSGKLEQDIAQTKALLKGKTVLGIGGTCLDHKLYELDTVGALSKPFAGTLNELAPAVLKSEADTSLLDVADSLVALNKWPGQIKILGPISEQQQMGVGFRKDSPELRQAFATFYARLQADGTYTVLVRKYYPDVFYYYPDFFAHPKGSLGK